METSELGALYCHICTPAPPIHNMLTGFLQFSGSLDPQYCCTAAGPMIIVIAICAIEALRDWSQHQQPTATVRHFIFVRLEIISNSRSSGLMDTFCNFPICFCLPNLAI